VSTCLNNSCISAQYFCDIRETEIGINQSFYNLAQNGKNDREPSNKKTKTSNVF
jgi:hypothetical protein